jgi:hypothetical protein
LIKVNAFAVTDKDHALDLYKGSEDYNNFKIRLSDFVSAALDDPFTRSDTESQQVMVNLSYFCIHFLIDPRDARPILKKLPQSVTPADQHKYDSFPKVPALPQRPAINPLIESRRLEEYEVNTDDSERSSFSTISSSTRKSHLERLNEELEGYFQKLLPTDDQMKGIIATFE